MPAYDPAAPPAKQFRNPVHCASASNDGLLYVCDRNSDRLRVFKPDGTFIREVFIARGTRASGSVWDVAFSRDPQQQYLYISDGMNNRVHALRRDTLDVLTSFGHRPPLGQFFGVHSIATDSKGTYTTETWKESGCRSSCTAASTTCRGGRRASSGRGPDAHHYLEP